MELKAGLEKIEKYFASVDGDQLYNDLVDCGLGQIKSWTDIGVDLAYSSEIMTYSMKSVEFNLATNVSTMVYSPNLAEAA